MKKRDDNGATQHATAIAVPLGVCLAIWGGFIYFNASSMQWPANTIILIFAIHWTAICYLLWLLFSRPQVDYLSSPIVKQVRDDGRMLMVANAPWLGLRVHVAVYMLDGEFERFISVGYVKNVQGNKLVQVELPLSEGLANPFSGVDCEKILVKPGIYPEAVQ